MPLELKCCCRRLRENRGGEAKTMKGFKNKGFKRVNRKGAYERRGKGFIYIECNDGF